MGKKPSTPPGLSAGGRRFWRETVGEYEFRTDELILLQQVCKMLDTVEALADRAASVDPVVVGSTGQPRVHPLLPELRQQQMALSVLLRRLGLPDPPAAEMPTSSRSRAGRHAVSARWGHA